jgi:hypothetical protein
MEPGESISAGRLFLIPISRSVAVKRRESVFDSIRILERMAIFPFLPVTFCREARPVKKSSREILKIRDIIGTPYGSSCF